MKKIITIEEYLKANNGKKKKRKWVYCILFALCLFTLLFSLYTIFEWTLNHYKNRQIHKELEENVNIESHYGEGELVNPPSNKQSDYYYYVTLPFYEADFSYLLSKNKDTVAFLHLNHSNIHYPVVQSSDNEYYLKHSFDGSENDAGWVFLDYRNHIDPLDENTIIYGHSMLDYTMFGSLQNVLKEEWQKNRDNYVIFLSTLKENFIFQIFSIYTTEKEGYYIIPNFESDAAKEIWIQTMKERNVAPIDVEVGVEDKFLTLSTCLDSYGGRIVVHAKLIKKQTRS